MNIRMGLFRLRKSRLTKHKNAKNPTLPADPLAKPEAPDAPVTAPAAPKKAPTREG